MPVIALALFAVFAALGFGWRSWEQRRRTGSTGFQGISGRLGSSELFAGVGFVAALLAAVAAPVLQLAGVLSPLGVLTAPWIQAGGIVLALVGIAATVYAQVDMGDSWRIGVDPGETTTLVRTGVFGWVRNPIFTAMLTFGFGIAVLTPNLVAVVGFVLLVGSIQLQVRVVEEPYLLSVHGDTYRDYLGRVGRFVPGIGLRFSGPRSVGWMGRKRMGRKQTSSKQSSGWLWLPAIFGLIIGATVTPMTDQWWWTTVGVLVGAAVGALSAGKLR